MAKDDIDLNGCRVLQLSDYLSTIGGIESCIRELSNELVAVGAETCVVVSQESAVPIDQQPGWSALHLDFDDVDSVLDLAAGFRPDVILLHQIAVPKLSKALRSQYLTVEIVHTTLCAGMKLFRRQDKLCTHSVSTRCLLDWYAGPCGTSPNPIHNVRSLTASRAHIQELRHLSHVVVATRFMKKYLIGEGIPAEKIQVLSLMSGKEQSIRQMPPRVSPGKAGEGVRLLFVGRVTYSKGLQYLLRALQQLQSEFTLDVVGNGWFLEDARKLASRLGITERIRFLGSRVGRDLDDVYGEADVVVVPSIWPEPLALVVGEARRRGLPVVVADSGGLAEWGDDDPGVHVVSRADSPALVAGIYAALASRPGYLGEPVLPRLSEFVLRIARGHEKEPN